MIIEQIWVGNALRNFNYLVACGETGEALVIDPLDHKQCLQIASDRGWTITHILNTHEHHDHIAGNSKITEATGAKILAHANAFHSIPNIDRGLKANDEIVIGRSVRLQCLDTPGHTMSHICAFADGPNPALFSGDTLFNAGAGNCHNGGYPEALYTTFRDQLAKLPTETKIYPGHDYLANNLEFTLNREPSNQEAKKLLKQVREHSPHAKVTTDLAMEKKINTFFRLRQKGVIQELQKSFPELPKNPDEKTVFLKLRQLRNRW